MPMVRSSPAFSLFTAMLFSFSARRAALAGQEAAMFGEQVHDGHTGLPSIPGHGGLRHALEHIEPLLLAPVRPGTRPWPLPKKDLASPAAQPSSSSCHAPAWSRPPRTPCSSRWWGLRVFRRSAPPPPAGPGW